jgi:DNA-binding IclR family transcriptional regulator
VPESAGGSGARLIALLRLIGESGRQLSLKEIAARSELPPSSAHRLLQTLARSGMVERGAQQSYGPGRELYRLAAIVRARFDPVRLARPFLEGLWERFDETAVLCIYNPASHTGTVIDALLTTHPLRFAVEIGMELALPWGSLGQAMLAHLAPKEIEAVLRGATIGPISGRPLASRAEVLDDLMAVREQGYADYYDPAFDVAGIAAPLFGESGTLLGCLGITMPSQRFELHERTAMVDAVRDAARSASELLSLHA